MSALFLVAGGISFFAGIQSVNDVETIEVTGAQTVQTTTVSVILQYTPVSGGAALPLVVTPVMNASQTALVNLQEIHSGLSAPSSPADRCRSTNGTGRCAISNVPVGGTPEAQYDLIVDTAFLEFLTKVPLETGNAFVRFDRAQCGSQTSFTATSGASNAWCLGKQGSTGYASEYTVTITLKERNTCTSSVPPAAFCDSDPKKIVQFSCNPSTTAATKPWEPKTSVCAGPVQCPDGNMVDGKCGKIGTSLASCSTAFACTGNQLCTVQNFGTNIAYIAGQDTIIIRGRHFGVAGGTVSFPTSGSARETVQIFPGADWTDTEIRVRVPLSAISGTLEIHPNTHGFFAAGTTITPAVCSSPAASIRSFQDQFSILSLNAVTPNVVQLVSPGFSTTFTIIAQHNENVGRFQSIVVELLDGAFPDPKNLPLKRTVIAQALCPVTILGSTAVREATIQCSVPVPASAASFPGPFTFLVTLADSKGGVDRAVLLDGGASAMSGDFNFDHSLSAEDAAIALRIARGATSVLPAHLARDTNNDNAITLADAIFVLHSLTR